MFILQNKDGYFLSKSGSWVDGREPNMLFRTLHRDEAVNQLFESNSQDYSLRITIVACEANAKKLPIILDELLPPPIVIDKDDDTRDDTLNNEKFKDESLFASSNHA